MAIFNSYVKLPEGNLLPQGPQGFPHASPRRGGLRLDQVRQGPSRRRQAHHGRCWDGCHRHLRSHPSQGGKEVTMTVMLGFLGDGDGPSKTRYLFTPCLMMLSHCNIQYIIYLIKYTVCLYQCYIYLLCFVFWGLVSLVVKYRGWNYRWRLSAIFTETMILPCLDILWGNLPPDDLPWVGGWNWLEDDFPKIWKAIPRFRIMQYPTSHCIPIKPSGSLIKLKSLTWLKS